MYLQALTPLFTSLTLSVVCAVCARRHHEVSDTEDVFTIPPAVGYMMLGIGIVFCIVPFLPGTAGDIPATRFFWCFSPFWLSAFIAAVFFFRYRVVVRDQTLTYGGFHRRVVPFSEVIDFDVLRGLRSSELWVYLKNGKRLSFSGMLSDFDVLVQMVESHVVRLSGPEHDSAAKSHDQERRKRGNRGASLIMITGALITAFFVFLLWRLQLLQ
jgi:small nuclear ribonucleoprotein (snRNP)-like protein